MNESDENLRRILQEARTIALIGASAKPERASYQVGTYLTATGRRVIPVNPGLAGQVLFGETVVGGFEEISDPVDMVDVFRRSEHVPDIVDSALTHLPGLKSIWMQLGVVHTDAAERAQRAGLDVVMNRCPKIEIPRLFP